MFALGNLLVTVGRLLNFLIGVYIWLIIIRALLSWFNPDPYSKFVRIIVDLTEPALKPVRKYLPISSGIDFSPFIVIIVLYFAKSFIVATITDLGLRLH